MKKNILAIALLVALKCTAQVYPFGEGFGTQPTGQVPAGWGGNAKVMLDHGLNGGRGLAADVSSINDVDTAITPLIGPLTTSSTISFYFRILAESLYPFTLQALGPGDSFNTQVSTDGINYTTVLSVNDSSYTSSSNFKHKTVAIPQFAGQNVYVRFLYTFGNNGGGYYVDVDSVTVKNDPLAAIEEEQEQATEFTVYPNPVTAGNNCFISVSNIKDENIELSLTDLLGKMVLSTNYKPQVATRQFELSTANLNPGFYLLNIGGAITRKIIIR